MFVSLRVVPDGLASASCRADQRRWNVMAKTHLHSKRSVGFAFTAALTVLGAAPSALADGTGWFSSDQLGPGRWEYSQKCSVCHGAQLQGGGAPALKGQIFIKQWSGKSL